MTGGAKMGSMGSYPMKVDSGFVPLHRFRELGACPASFPDDIPYATPEILQGAGCPFPKPPPPGANTRNTWSHVRTLAMERYILRLSLSS